MPFAGEVLDLSYQLLDGDTTKFVRATLREADGTLFAQPSLPHIGEGKYATDAVTMPSGVDYLSATYEPFNDALFTIPDEDHLFGTDSFRLEIPDSVIVAKIDAIKAVVDATFDKVCEILAKLLQQIPGLDRLKSIIVSENVVSKSKDEKLLSQVSEDGPVTVLASDKLKSTVTEDQVIGELQCPK